MDIIFAAILVETATERLKDMGLRNYSVIVATLLSFAVALAAKIVVVDVGNEVLNYLISGIILSGGSNYVNSVRDKLKS